MNRFKELQLFACNRWIARLLRIERSRHFFASEAEAVERGAPVTTFDAAKWREIEQYTRGIIARRLAAIRIDGESLDVDSLI